MSDYIKREDAVERVAFELMYEAAIAKDLSYKELLDLEKEKQERIKLYIQKWLEQLPSADVVEVVRCKDCEYWNKDEDVLNDGICDEWSDFEDGIISYTKPDDYCSCGERKEEENE